MNNNRERREKGKESEVKRGERKKNKKIIYTMNNNRVYIYIYTRLLFICKIIMHIYTFLQKLTWGVF